MCKLGPHILDQLDANISSKQGYRVEKLFKINLTRIFKGKENLVVMVIMDVKRELLKRSLLQENRDFALGVEDGYRAPVSASYLMIKCL